LKHIIFDVHEEQICTSTLHFRQNEWKCAQYKDDVVGVTKELLYWEGSINIAHIENIREVVTFRG
jgi:hypothetical protein